jgi:hypothetical protein
MELGEAKPARRLHRQIFERFPQCIHCAGLNVADTIDHVPPRMMFRDKQDRLALSFPVVNVATKRRSTRSSWHPCWPACLRMRARPTFQSFSARSFLGFLAEMKISRAGQKLALGRELATTGAKALKTNGPLVSKPMHAFAAKLGFAVFFESVGSPIPEGGAVQSRWFYNLQALRGGSRKICWTYSLAINFATAGQSLIQSACVYLCHI